MRKASARLARVASRLAPAALLPIMLSAASAQEPAEWFVDRAAESGLDFVHYNGMTGEYYFVENLGGGGALFDYDNDGDLDVFITQGQLLGAGKTWEDALFPPPEGTRLMARLYRNDLAVQADGTRTLRFTDVTDAAGIRAEGYGMGVAAGDYDNDGWIDLYVTNFGPNTLWHNEGDGTFTDLTEAAGVVEPRWSTSAAFVDYDRDGRLDLFVANYTDFTLDNNRICYAPTSARDYCSPSHYDHIPDTLFRNVGEGRFTDVSEVTRIGRESRAGLGVVVADFNRDGWADVYVANDGVPNQLWMNTGEGSFQNEALLAGTAVNMEGKPEASMGVDAADFDGDGDDDLFMTHIQGETNTIYVNDGQGWFEDRTLATGLGAPSKQFTAFGTVWLDYDNDGWLDLFIANGEVRVVPILMRQGDKYPLHQPNQLFHNRGDGRFEEVTGRAGSVFELSEVSRGAALGDVDNDGDGDVLLVNNNGPVRLLLNQIGNRRHWLGLRLVDAHERDGLGARVQVVTADGRSLWRRVRADGSYLSANDPRVLVGLGDAERIESVTVHWPSGAVEVWSDLAVNRYHSLREGAGAPAAGADAAPEEASP